MTLTSNRSLAEGNLLYQPRLDSLKASLTQKYQELQVLFEAYQIKKTKLDKQSNNASLETLLALLQAEGAKIEEDTENMAEKFLDGELSLDSFIDVYQSKRKLAHMRRVKIEKLQEMVLKGQKLPQAPAPLPPRVPEPALATPLSYPAPEASGPLAVVPRRVPPPPPPVPTGCLATPFAAATGLGQALPTLDAGPPLPPRVGLSSPGFPPAGFSEKFGSRTAGLPKGPPHGREDGPAAASQDPLSQRSLPLAGCRLGQQRVVGLGRDGVGIPLWLPAAAKMPSLAAEPAPEV
nr:vacuolar protein sorting-associated protein 37B [Loxodonta africana]